MENSHRSLIFLLLMLMGFLQTSSQAHKFLVGGKNGWVPQPPETYNHWAERMRFQVNDSLIFKYKKGSDSVLIVTQEDYNNCNTTKPIKALKDGTSVVKLNRSGPFFFISGNACGCDRGHEKLVVVVMAVRNRTHVPSPAPPVAPPTSWSPPAHPPKPVPPKPAPPTAQPPVDNAPVMAPRAVPSPSPSPADGLPGPNEGPSNMGAPTPPRSSVMSSAPVACGDSVEWALGMGVGVSLVLGSFFGLF
ncbi:early nodulin-like protein 3 [Malania oleifera]|uniref:early nodulin-like protein 3 n=1 Tax=Malania oleifera TaxID=397392 RepID=UPI0025ADF61D|nr:early nodulin-like protein 3 [Malania oleifera]